MRDGNDSIFTGNLGVACAARRSSYNAAALPDRSSEFCVAGWSFLTFRQSPVAPGLSARVLSVRDPRLTPWVCAALFYFASVAGTQQVLGFAVQDRLLLDASATARTMSRLFMCSDALAVLFQTMVLRRSRRYTIIQVATRNRHATTSSWGAR